jgi:restriction endonuclease S subunit
MNAPDSKFDQLKINPAWAKLPLFERKGWKRLPFGAFAESVNERAEPSEAAEEIYVGLEHLDPQDLHIRRWGKGSDVIGTKLRFRKGDIIFGRRRAYQRKLAVAEFDGICSAHAMVVRAKPKMVLPEFLPFLLMSDRFMKRAVEISVGSLSPTINWKTLKLEEFALPPLDHQRRIAEILWRADEGREAWGLQAQYLKLTLMAFSGDLFGNRHESKRSEIELGEVCKLQSGFPFKSSEFVSEGDKLLRGSNVGVNRLIWSPDVTKSFPSARRAEFKDYVLRPGDVVVAMDRPFIAEGFKIARVSDSDLPALLLQRVGRFQPSDRILPDFLWFYLNSASFQNQLRLSQQGTDLPHISRFDIESTKLHLPSLDRQKLKIEEFNRFENALLETDRLMQSYSGLIGNLQNGCFT